MNLRANFYRFMAVAVFLTCGLYPAMAQEGKKFKVLAVFSYEEDFLWDTEVRKGVDAVLAQGCDIKYFYMDTYKNLQGGEQKAQEAYALYQEFQPDGVIASDDNAQTMFVIPYLKDKVKTPVIFCGVNEDPEKYGYPSSNVSGVVEHFLIDESVSLAKQLMPSIATFGFIMKESSTSKAIFKQIQSESDNYAAKFVSFKEPASLKETAEMAEELRKNCDVLFVSSFAGIPDENGNPATDMDAFAVVQKAFGKPILGHNIYHVKVGALCGVSQSGAEQGETAAQLLLKAMQGTPISEIPITRNHQGMRMINVTVLKELGITPRPIVLQGAELVRTENRTVSTQ
ncbi:MAG: ABC transporter substrate binding protein [Desulfobacterales bacterium]